MKTFSNIPPYPGLRPFTELESLYFKGREKHIEKIQQALLAKRFLMVTGSSGDGKSSLVFAGLLPNIRAGFLSGEFGRWQVAAFRPGNTPLKNLSIALSDALNEKNPEEILQKLKYGYSALADEYKSSSLYKDAEEPSFKELEQKEQKKLLRKASNLLLVVDQFEEFFTNACNFNKETGLPSLEAQLVMNLLMETSRLSHSQKLPVYIICTMRSDFIGNAPAYRGLPELIGDNQFFVPRLNREELKRVIEEPAKLSGNEITPRLAERLLSSLQDGPDVLPVLQHALHQIYNIAVETNSEKMDLIHFAMIGGMSKNDISSEEKELFNTWYSGLADYKKELIANYGIENVLNAHANELYETSYDYCLKKYQLKISKEVSQKIIKIAFSCLIKTDEGKTVRNRMSLGEIKEMINLPEADVETIAQLLEIFRIPGTTLLYPFLSIEEIQNPSIIKKQDPDAIFDITHEALIRNWHLLNDWMLEEQNRIETYYDFKIQLNRWLINNKSKDFLLPEGSWNYFNDWFENLCSNYNNPEAWLKRYLHLNEKNKDSYSNEKNLTSEISYSQKHLTDIRDFLIKSKKALNVKKNVFKGITAIIFILFVFSTYSYFQSHKQQIISKSNELSALSFLKLLSDPSLSFRLGEEAYKLSETSPFAQKAIYGPYYGTSFSKLYKHPASVGQAEFSKDGQFFITSCSDNKVRIFRQSGELANILVHPGYIDCFKVTEDQKYIITSCQDSIVSLWEWSGKLLFRTDKATQSNGFNDCNFRVISKEQKLLVISDSILFIYDYSGKTLAEMSHPKGIASVDISTDNKWILTVCYDRIIRLWGIGGDIQKTYDDKEGDYGIGKFAPNQKYFVVCTYWSKFSKIFYMNNSSPKKLIGHTHGIHGLDFTSNSKYIVTISYDRKGIIWDSAGQKIRELNHKQPLDIVQISPDNKYIITAPRDNSIRLWDFNGNEIQVLSHPNSIFSASFSPDSKSIITGCRDKICRIWNVNTNNTPVFSGHADKVLEAGFCEDENKIISASSDSTLRFWSINGEEIKKIKMKDGIEKFAFPKNPTEFSVVNLAHQLVIIDTSGTVITKPKGAKGLINSISYSDDGKFLSLSSENKSVLIWDRQSKAEPVKLSHPGKVIFSDISPNGKFIISCTEDSTLHFWDIGTMKEKLISKGKAFINYVSFSEDGKYFVSASDDFSINIWSVEDTQLIKTITGNESIVNSVSFSPDNRLIAASQSEFIKIFDWEGRELITINRHLGAVNNVCFSSDSKYLLSCSDDKNMRLNLVNIDEIIERINNSKEMGPVREFSPEEKIEYQIK